MAFLLASFGPSVGQWNRREWNRCEWTRAVDQLAELSPVRLWPPHEGGSSVRLGVSGSGGGMGSRRDSGADVATVSAGTLDGEPDVAAAILDAFLARGVEGLARFRGEYAFVLWDGRTEALLVGCDAVGLQAPAYRWDGQAFLLCSRALALVPAGPTRAKWDGVYLAHVLGGLWCQPPDATPFQGLRRMKGGELLRVSRDGLERLAGEPLRFALPAIRHRQAAMTELEMRLERAVVAASSRSETCVALSGGLDSSVITALAAKAGRLDDAFSLVAPAGSVVDSGAAAAAAAFPHLRHHRVDVPDAQFGPVELLPDDPVCTASVLEAGRVALYRAARAAGFRRVLDGEGGDELFDVAWWSIDLLRERAIGAALDRVARRRTRSRILDEFALGHSGALVAPVWKGRAERIATTGRRRRPWLREAFWQGAEFAEATTEASSYRKLRAARDRLPAIVGTHGRYWRAQDLSRARAGLEGASPYMNRDVIEFVGSLGADMVIDRRHTKGLLRHLAARLLPPALALRSKQEPLHEWLTAKVVSSEAHLATALRCIGESGPLREFVDPAALVAAHAQARRERMSPPELQPLVEFITLTHWMAGVEARQPA
jgi:asparagine synthase (glutamine-hydrolysing)